MNTRPPSSTPPIEPFPATGISPEARRTLRLYLERLLHVNRSLNLTAITDPETAWQRHILESIALIPHLQSAQHLLDLGSGGGIPGIPLAILLPRLDITLLEATGKKARFLRETCEALGLSRVTVCAERAEHEGRNPASREQFDAVTCRAVGSLAEILELAAPLLRVGGHLLAVKGRRADEELHAAEKALELLHCVPTARIPLLPGDPDNESILLILEKKAPTPDRFPRPAGTPKKTPLQG